jgi:hypothetical protein
MCFDQRWLRATCRSGAQAFSHRSHRGSVGASLFIGRSGRLCSFRAALGITEVILRRVSTRRPDGRTHRRAIARAPRHHCRPHASCTEAAWLGMLNRYVLLGPIQENANDADWRNSTPSGEQVALPVAKQLDLGPTRDLVA